MFWLLNRLRGSANKYLTTDTSRLIFWCMPWLIVCNVLADIYDLPGILAVLCALMALGGVMLGHGFAQGDSKKQYAEMGLVSFTRLAGIFLPLLIGSCYRLHPAIELYAALPLIYFLAWGASALSYSPMFQSRALTMFGIKLCVQGDSSWEELLVGAAYDITLVVSISGHYL